MKSRVTRDFRAALAVLPKDVQRKAQSAYQLFLSDPTHPGLQLKLVKPVKQIYSVRIGRRYRALGVKYDDVILWFWIGSHAEYDEVLSQL